jgi:hypothetical protein
MVCKCISSVLSWIFPLNKSCPHELSLEISRGNPPEQDWAARAASRSFSEICSYFFFPLFRNFSSSTRALELPEEAKEVECEGERVRQGQRERERRREEGTDPLKLFVGFVWK